MEDSTIKMGRWQKSRYAVSSSWKVLKLDKELGAFAVINIILVPFIALVGLIATLVLRSTSATNFGSPSIVAVGIVCGALIYLVTTYTGAAIVAGALTRFRGGDPSIGSSVSAVRRRLGSLTAFALFYGTIVQLLQLAERRLPLVGQIFAWLANIGISVASIFSIPVIVDSNQPISPIGSIKKSVGLLKQTWGESLITSFSIGIVMFALVALEIGVSILVLVTLNHVVGLGGNGRNIVDVVFSSLMVISFILTVIVGNALGSIIKAAIYHYAMTGESPAEFDKELMKQAFSPKKARKLFV